MAVLLQLREGVLKLFLIVLLFPWLVVNERTIGPLLSRYARWRTFNLHVTAPKLLDKRVELQADDLCFDLPRAKGCLRRLELDVTVRLWRPSLLAVDRLVVIVDELIVTPGPKKETTEDKPLRGLPRLPRVGFIHVEVPSFEYGKFRGRLAARHADGRFELRARLPQGELDAWGAYGDKTLDALARGRAGPRQGEAVVRVSSSAAKLDLAVREPGRSLLVNLAGTPQRVRGDVAVSLSTGAIREAKLSRCDLRREGRAARLACGLRLVPGLIGGRKAPLKTVTGRLSARGELSGGDDFAAEADVALGPAKDWYEVSAKVRAEAEGKISELREAEVRHDFEVFFDVPRFARLVEWAKGTKLAVPAPLHVLEGPLKIAARGSGREARLEASADLRSERQRLKLAAAGDLELLRKRPQLDFDITLEDVELELPRLDLGPMPDVTVDPRIKVSTVPLAPPPPPTKRAPPPFDLDAGIKTVKPIRLRSNLAKDPVPIDLDLEVQPPKVSGRIDVRTFDVELFRRRMTVDHFDLRPAGSGAYEMDGLILYKTPDAVVKILLLGSTAKPRVEFLSDPPLERDQIIALLLFNKPPDQLDDTQQESVGNTQNALASNALGLATLYLFASTPIEYVGYDPATQGYSVRFKLPGGATMEVGGNDEQKRLTLRKRLSSHWALQTEVRNEEDEGNAATTFLEWFNRF